jgi:integrase/recombinase XerD
MATRQRQNLAASLYWHCKTETGWRRFRVKPSANGRLRKGWVIDKGVERCYTEGVYHLRTFKDGKTIFKVLTDDAAAALSTSKTTKDKLLADKHYLAATGTRVSEREAGEKSLLEMRPLFIEHVGLTIEDRSVFSYGRILELFFQTVRKTMPAEINVDDFSRCIKAMEKDGLGKGTIFSYSYRLRRFLRYAGVPEEQLPVKGKMPKEHPPEVEVYNNEVVDQLIAGAKTLRNSLFYEFLVKTGAREREATHVQWQDIDFVGKKVQFYSKPEFNFRIKNDKPRTVPLTDALVESLKDYHAKHRDLRFVFGTNKDSRPRKNSLRYLKRDVWRLGLACKRCDGCLNYRECEKWKLHRFRATFATNCLQSGIDVYSLKDLMGHADIKTTMRYLKAARISVTQANLTSAFDRPRPAAAGVIVMPKRKAQLA